MKRQMSVNTTANGTQVLVQPLSSEAQQQITGGERTGADRLVLYTEELKTNPNARP